MASSGRPRAAERTRSSPACVRRRVGLCLHPAAIRRTACRTCIRPVGECFVCRASGVGRRAAGGGRRDGDGGRVHSDDGVRCGWGREADAHQGWAGPISKSERRSEENGFCRMPWECKLPGTQYCVCCQAMLKYACQKRGASVDAIRSQSSRNQVAIRSQSGRN